MRNGHKAAACPYAQLWLLGEPREPWENPVPGLCVRVECARRSTESLWPIPSSFLSPVTWTNPNSCNTTLERVLSSIGGTTLRREAGGRNPNTRRRKAHRAFQSSSRPEVAHPLGAVGIVSLEEDVPASGGCGLMQRGRGSPGPWGRAHWLAHSPQLRQPHDSPSSGNKPAQASGMCQQPRSPRPEGNRVDIHSL